MARTPPAYLGLKEEAAGVADPGDARRSRYMVLPPLAVHSAASLASVKPWPLQPFWPLQALAAPLQALWPLHALVPPQCTPAALAVEAMKVVAANIEAAAAMMACVFMGHSLLVGTAPGFGGGQDVLSCMPSTPRTSRPMAYGRST